MRRKKRLCLVMALALALTGTAAFAEEAVPTEVFAGEMPPQEAVVEEVELALGGEETEAPETPEAADVTETPEAPETPETPEAPEVLEASEVLEVPETLEVPEVPEVPEMPEAPEVLEVPEMPEAPEAPEIPEAADVTEVPGAPEAMPAEAVAPQPPVVGEVPDLGPQAVAAPAGPLVALTLPPELVLGVKEQAKLAPIPTPADAVCGLTFATSKKKIVAVAEDGTLTAKKKGSAVVTVTADNGVSAQVTVTVVKAPKSVTLTAPAVAGLGDRFGCAVSFPAKTGGGYGLFSDNEAVLHVEPDGSVSALALGSAILTVRTYNGREDHRSVQVLGAPAAMWLNAPQADVGLGGTFQLGAAFPEGTGGTVTYFSSDPGVAPVDPFTGLVTGAALGCATVTARCYNGLEDHCAVRVLPAPQSLALPASAITLGVGEQVLLTAMPLPEGAACSLTYRSGKAKVAEVSGDGVLTAKKKGKATITIKAQNGVGAKLKVTVLAAPDSLSLTLGKSNLAVGESTKAACQLPKKTGGCCTFSVDNPAVASVAPDGTVTALAEGAATVIATAYNGVTASAVLTVGTPPSPQPPVPPGEVSGPFEMTFMNIGRNDGILIHCGGEWAFVDSGMRQEGFVAVDYMRARGVDRLRYYIASHGHIDHVGGAPVILAAIPTQEIIAAYDKVIPQIRKYAETEAEEAAIDACGHHVVGLGERFYLGGAEFLVLGPVSIVRTDPLKQAENGNSLILRVTYGSNTFLLTGDANGSEVNEVQAANPGCLQAQVFKNPHHNAINEQAALLCQPKITVFSTRKGKLPKKGYLNVFRNMGSLIYITAENRHGHVTLVSDGTTITVTTEKEYPNQ